MSPITAFATGMFVVFLFPIGGWIEESVLWLLGIFAVWAALLPVPDVDRHFANAWVFPPFSFSTNPNDWRWWKWLTNLYGTDQTDVTGDKQTTNLSKMFSVLVGLLTGGQLLMVQEGVFDVLTREEMKAVLAHEEWHTTIGDRVLRFFACSLGPGAPIALAYYFFQTGQRATLGRLV